MTDKYFYHILFIILIVYVAWVAIYVTYSLVQINQRAIGRQWFFYTLEDKVYKLKIADNAISWEKGLSGIQKKPDNYDGMIFVFPNKQIRPFWNKETYLDLHVIWLKDFQIVQEDELPSIKNGLKIITPKIPVNYVIELFK
jgi:uncharacterized membrane protein (UPF0127 family)